MSNFRPLDLIVRGAEQPGYKLSSWYKYPDTLAGEVCLICQFSGRAVCHRRGCFLHSVVTNHRWQSYPANSSITLPLVIDQLLLQNSLLVDCSAVGFKPVSSNWLEPKPSGSAWTHTEEQPDPCNSNQQCRAKAWWLKMWWQQSGNRRKRAGINMLVGGIGGGTVGRRRLWEAFVNDCEVMQVMVILVVES